MNQADRRLPVTAEPGDRTLCSRMVIVWCGIVILFSLLSWRLIHLQVARHHDFAEMAARNRIEQKEIAAPRGRIFDSRSLLLARDEPVQRIVFDLGMLRDEDSVIRMLVRASKVRAKAGIEPTALTARDYREKPVQERQDICIDRILGVMQPFLAVGDEPMPDIAALTEKVRQRREKSAKSLVVLEKALPVEKAVQMREALEAAGFDEWHETEGHIGPVRMEQTYVRRRGSNLPLEHVVGVLRQKDDPERKGETITVGASGVERFCNEQLSALAGLREFEVDGTGLEMPGYRRTLRKPAPGRNVMLTLDSGMQRVVLEELKIAAATHRTQRAICVLFEPSTMAVRVIAAVDLTLKETPVLFNHAVEYAYEPGSTFKIATVSAALNAGVVSLATVFDLHNGCMELENAKDVKDHKGMASGTTRDVMLESSNIGACQMAMRLGTGRFEKYLRDFGFGSVTGTQLPLELSGRLPPSWRGDYLSRASYGGYGMLVTPLQMCAMLGCVLNDGEWKAPRMVEGFTGETGILTERLPDLPSRRVLTRNTAVIMQDLLRDVVEKGTGSAAASALYSVAGKTGSARKSKNGEYDQASILSFLGCMPAENPRLAGILILDEPDIPRSEAWGGKHAGPVFTRIMEKCMAYLQVPPEFQPEPSVARSGE